MSNTGEFWQHYVLPKLQGDFWGIHCFLARPYPHGSNEYLEKVEANVQRVREKMARRRAQLQAPG